MRKRRIKKKYKLVLILFLIIICLLICFVFIKKDKITKSLFIEVGESVPEASDFIEGASGDIKWDKKISLKDNKTIKIGTYTGTIKSGVKRYKVSLVVGDTTVPVITGFKDITTTVNEKIDLLENIIVNDNSNEKIIATVKGEYDLSKTGKYNLSYEACDSSDNCSSEDFVLTVQAKKSSSNDSNVIEAKYVDGVLIVNKSFPLPADYVPENLVSAGGNATAIDYVVEAFNKLKEDATAQGLNIYASTAYRSYSFQKTLYTNYVNRDGKEEADTYSARPGYSEHQTGLAIDCNSVNNSFTNTDEGIWLNDNAWKYGFIIRFPKGKESETGYSYESWHLRYVGTDLAKKLYNNGSWLSLEGYFNLPSEYED